MSNVIYCDDTGSPIKHFYQWDSKQKIIITGLDVTNVTEVHFCNIDSDEAIVVAASIVDNTICANIPDILLQQAKPLIVYTFQGPDNESLKTISATRITVIPRAKPADYAYSETEVLNYRVLDARIKALENTGTTDYTKLANRPVIPSSVTAVEHQYAVSNTKDSVSDVTTWTGVTSSLSQRERSCIFANGYYVVCGVDGEVGYSKDGVNWAKVDKFVSGTLTNIAYGKGKYIIVDEFDGLWMAEGTPEVWTQINDGAEFVGGIGSLTYANNQFVIAGGNLAAFSEDGLSWTIVEAPGSYNQITFGNGRYVAVGANGSVGVSYDGKNWIDGSNPAVTGDLRAVTYAKGRYIIGGIDGLIMYTEDFVTWGIATSDSAGVRYVRQITYAENKYYAACYTSSGKGEIWTSLDGITWTVQQQMNYRLWCLNYNDGKLTTAGDSGAVFILDLGIVWLPKQTELADGQHLWERIVFTLSDGGKVVSDGVCIKSFQKTETLTFVLADGSTVTRTVCVVSN